MSKLKVAFNEISRPERQSKPRTRGLTMMIDWGMGLVQQEDVLRTSAHYIDSVKIAASIATLLPKKILKKKLQLYKRYGVETGLGGLFAELTIKQGSYDTFLQNAKDLGFDGIEVSDNLLKISAKDKAAAIRHAKDDYGLTVYGEVGRKEGKLTDGSVLDDIQVCLDAGSKLVYLEAAELFDGDKARDKLIATIAERFDLDKLSFELPVVVIPGASHWAKTKIASKLIATLGTEVNMANIEYDEILFFEMFRLGMGSDTSHPDGAYRRAGFTQ